MKNIFKKLMSFKWLILTFVSSFVFILPQLPIRSIVGWDGVYSHFNFGINLSKYFSGSWLNYSSVGHLSGIPITTDVSRTIMILLIGSVSSPENLRFLWMMTMIFLGPLGVYFLVKEFLVGSSNRSVGMASYIASFVYLFNFATVQSFYTAFEPFVALFGFLPLFLLASQRFLKSKKWSTFTIIITFLLGSSAFYVQTLFLVVTLLVGILGIVHILESRVSLPSIKKTISLFLLVFAVNLYWLVPSIIYTIRDSSVVVESMSNYLSTEETRLMNDAFSGLLDIFTFKSFWLEYLDYDGANFVRMMQPWHEHVYNGKTTIIQFSSLLLALLGLLLGAIKFRPLALVSLLIILTSVIFLVGSLPLPLFSQIFRSPFTKWSLPLALGVSLCVAQLFLSLNFIKGRLRNLVSCSTLVVVVVINSLIVYPIFNGKLIYEALSVSVPEHYYEMFNKINDLPGGTRVASFPSYSHWGWSFKDWGYRGSSLLTYGIKHSLMDRTFDVWNKTGEEYYDRISKSLYNNDVEAFRSTLGYYNVNAVIVDESIIVPGQADQGVLEVERINTFLSEFGNLYWNSPDNGLKVYTIESNHRDDFFKVGSAIVNQEDTDYQSRLAEKSKHPFSELLLPKRIELQKSKINEEIYFGTKAAIDGELIIPPLDSEIKLSGEIVYSNTDLTIKFENLAKVFANKNTVEIKVDNIYLKGDFNKDRLAVSLNGKIYYLEKGLSHKVNVLHKPGDKMLIEIYSIDNQKKRVFAEFNAKDFSKCWVRDGLLGEIDVREEGGRVNIKSRDAAACTSIKIGKTDFVKSVANLSLDYEPVIAGSKPSFCLLVEGGNECLHDDIFYSGVSDTLGKFSVDRSVLFEKDTTYWLVVTARPSDIEGKDSAIKYSKPVLKEYPLVYSFVVQGFDRDLLIGKRLAIESGQELQVNLPFSPLGLDVEKSVEVKNCDSLKRGSVEANSFENNIYIKASGYGSLCFTRITPNFTNNSEGFLEIYSKNISGRPLKVFVFNQTSKRTDREFLLHRGGEVGETYSIGSWGNLDESAYAVTLENRAFGGVDAENIFYGMNYVYAPLEWLSSIYVVNNQVLKGQGGGGGIARVSQLAPAIFSIDYYGSFDLYSNFGKDGLWLGLQNFRLIPQTKTDSWANSWFLEDCGFNSCNIKFVYLPQLIQYVIYTGSVGCLVFMLAYSRMKHKVN